MKPLKVIAIGEIVWDMLPTGKQLGGAPLNFAFFAKELGAEALAISAIGRDALGDETLEAASKTGVELSFVQRNELPTSRVLVSLNAEGVPQYEIVEGVAWDAIACDDATIEAMHNASVVCWGSLAQRSETSRTSVVRMLEAAPREALKVFDINIRQHYYDRTVVEASLQHANTLKLNEDELPLVAALFDIEGSDRAQIEELMRRFDLRYIVYTHGAQFSEVYGRDGEFSHLATPRVAVADTVGAGDSFTAVFVTSLLQGRSLAESHALAVEVAAYVCTRAGAINPLPQTLLDRLK